MALQDFIAKYTGQQLTDNSGNFRGECVSLVKRYAQEVQGVPNADAVLYCQNTGGARDLFEDPTPATLQYYFKVASPQVGDIVVWGASMGLYGDTAIYLGNQVFGQLGTPVFRPAAVRTMNPSPIGYLRRKGEPMITKEDIDNLYPKLLRRPADAGAYAYVGKSFHDFIYDLVQSAEFAKLLQSAPANKQAIIDYLTANLK